MYEMIVYQLKADTKFIEQVQHATRTTKEFGIEPTHGLFGTEEWWKQIANGSLPVVTLTGFIAKCYMGSMNDWPMFDLIDGLGEKTSWTRQVNAPEQDTFYREGSMAEINFVLQNSRPLSWSKGAQQKQVLEIRISNPSTL
jgi:hypothetical protein